MGLDEAAAELQDADAEPEEVASTLQDAAPGAYKHVRKKHYKEGKSEVENELNSAQDKIASLRKEKQSLEEKVDKGMDESPEVEELRQNYEKKIGNLESTLDEVKSEKEEAVQSWKEKTRAVKGTTFKEKVASTLKEQGVDPDYADFKAQEAVSGNRVQFEGEDGLEIGLYEDGVPVRTSDDQPKHEAFAQNLAEEVPDKFVEDPRPDATMNGNPASGAGSTQVTRSQFEEMSQEERMAFTREGGEVVPD
jgi:flagellar biosynthesis chaperone FliJ